MDIFGLEARQSELARGIVIVKCRAALTRAEQRALWHEFASAGITEDDSDETAADDDEQPLRLLTAPWLPPLTEEIPAQRAAIERASALHVIEVVWFVKVETGIDGEAWHDLRSTHFAERMVDETTPVSPPPRVVDAIFDKAEVLYSAPDAGSFDVTTWPATSPDVGGVAGGGEARGLDPVGDDGPSEGDEPGDPDDAGDDGGDDDDLDDPGSEGDAADDVMQVLMSESHWRNGGPPTELSVPFPLEQYPEVLDDYDWREFGIALKLGGTSLPGEELVVNAFFALWLSAYQDERSESFEPFARADVAHDSHHRSALLWVERFTVPATPSDQVHFLLWIIHRLHEVVPVAWARFDIHEESSRIRRDDAGEVELILAGNPLAERARRYSEDDALTWAVAQSAWSRRELAAMLVEMALDYDPDVAESAGHAERLLRRALSFDATSEASSFLLAVLVRHGRTAEAIPLAHQGRSPLRLLLAREVAEYAESKLSQVLPLLDPATMEAADDEDVADLAHVIGMHAPRHLRAYLDRTPNRVSLLPHLYNASFNIRRDEALSILRRVLVLPEPEKSSTEARSAMVMAWNNACIHAHALGEYPLAAEIADGGQRFAEENPHIYHSAACAYAAIGDLPRALAAVRNAVVHDYEHIEKMETDPDLAPLHPDPAFKAIFAEWRHQRADLN
jgi:tetratricopeptide (TPR) repeat protein